MPEVRIPGRVLALAALIGDEPIGWSPEREDGSITIVFRSKGKMRFEPEPTIEPEVPSFEPIIHTNEDAQEVVKTLTPTHEPSPKKRRKQ